MHWLGQERPERFGLNKETWAAFHLAKISGPTVEVQMDAWFKWKFSGTNGRPHAFGGIPLFPSNKLERKLPSFHLHKISTSACESARAYTNFLAPSRSTNEIASFSPFWKKPFLTESGNIVLTAIEEGDGGRELVSNGGGKSTGRGRREGGRWDTQGGVSREK